MPTARRSAAPAPVEGEAVTPLKARKSPGRPKRLRPVASEIDGESPPDHPEAGRGGAPLPGGVRLLKKYPNRRLYDTATSSYITLHDVKNMVMGSQSFEVRDAKSGEDLTRAILLQIILEEETGGVPIFSSQMLAQIIRFYGHTLQGAMGHYLERNLQLVTDLQKGWADQAAGLPKPTLPPLMSQMVEQSQQLFSQMQDSFARQAKAFPGFGLNRRKPDHE